MITPVALLLLVPVGAATSGCLPFEAHHPVTRSAEVIRQSSIATTDYTGREPLFPEKALAGVSAYAHFRASVLGGHNLAPVGRGSVAVSVSNIQVGSSPGWAELDPKNGFVYVENSASGNVSVLNGTSLLATVAVGADPCWATFDSGNGFVYVTNGNSKSVSVINGTSVVATVEVGTDPCYPDYDSRNGWVYVPNYGSDNVSVINGTTLEGTVRTGLGSTPWDATFDNRNGYVYITDGGTNRLSVLSGLKTVASVAVGSTPYYAIYNALNGYLYVPNIDSGNTSIINGTSVIGSPATGLGPDWATVDDSTGQVYVPDYFSYSGQSSNVSVINGTTLLAGVVVGTEAQMSTFDSRNGFLYVPNVGSNNVSMIAGTTVVGSVNVGGSPYAAMYDNATGTVYVTNSATNSVSVLVTQPTYAATFAETGLPAGTSWSVTFAGDKVSSTSSTIEFPASNATYQYSAGRVPGWTTPSFEGAVTIDGSESRVTLNWTQVTYPTIFAENGLPSGSAWSLNVTGHGSESTSSTTITLTIPNGTYGFSASTPTQGVHAVGGTIRVIGEVALAAVNFAQSDYEVGFSEVGLPAGVVWWVNLSGGGAAFSGSNLLSFSEPNGLYVYSVSTSDKSYSAPGGTFTVFSGPTSVAVAFSPDTWNVTLSPVGLPLEAHWSASLGSEERTGQGSLTFSDFENGSYALSVGSVPGYFPNSTEIAVRVTGNDQTDAVQFEPVPASFYPITFVETGLPQGEAFTVDFNSTTVTSQNGSILAWEPNGSYDFTLMPIKGLNASRAAGSIVVSGRPVVIHLDFVSAGSRTSGPTTTQLFLGFQPAMGLAVLAAAVAVVVMATYALSIWTRRRPPGGGDGDDTGSLPADSAQPEEGDGIDPAP